MVREQDEHLEQTTEETEQLAETKRFLDVVSRNVESIPGRINHHLDEFINEIAGKNVQIALLEAVRSQQVKTISTAKTVNIMNDNKYVQRLG